LTRLDTKRKP